MIVHAEIYTARRLINGLSSVRAELVCSSNMVLFALVRGRQSPPRENGYREKTEQAGGKAICRDKSEIECFAATAQRDLEAEMSRCSNFSAENLKFGQILTWLTRERARDSTEGQDDARGVFGQTLMMEIAPQS